MIPHQTIVTDTGTLTRLLIPDNEWMTTEDLRRMARQLNELAIDGQRLAEVKPPSHPATPSYFEYPTFDESADFDAVPLNDHDVYRRAEEKING